MYTPKSYTNENTAEVKEFVAQNSFGILVSNSEERVVATHIPIELTTNAKGEEVLQGHLAKANPQWKSFKNNTEVLCIFNGADSYISSSWYDFEEVPTWNYIAVHIYGKIKIIEGEELLQSLKYLVDKYETNSEKPVSIENLSEKTMRQINGIVGFEIEITDIQATKKLSQTRDDKNYSAIINELEKSECPNSRAIAKEMKKERE